MTTATRSWRPPPAAEPEKPQFGLPRVVVPATLLLAVVVGMLWYANSQPEASVPTPTQYVASVPTSSAPLAGIGGAVSSTGGSQWQDGPNPASPGELDAALDLRLTQTLAQIDFTSDRAVYRLLETLGASRAEEGDQFRAVIASLLRLREQSRDPRVRCAALALLARAPDCPTLVEPFLVCFNDGDARVRREAVLGRARRGSAPYAQFLVPLARDADAGVRAAVAVALAGTRQPEARAALLTLFADADDVVMDAAAASLACGITETPPAAVFAASKSDRYRARMAAARVLGEARTPECLAPLTQLAGDPVWEVRREAVRQLMHFGGGSGPVACARVQALACDPKANRTDRFEALQALAGTETPPNLNDLATVATKDDDPALRLAAARSLLARGDVRACAVLVALTGVEIGPHCDFEDQKFVRTTAAATIREITDASCADADVDGWRRLQTSFEARVRLKGFEYRPAYLPERW